MDDFDDVDEKLRKAKAAFLEASDGYDKKGSSLRRRCDDHFSKFTDASAKRAPEIRDAARDVLRSLASFDSVHAGLTSDIAVISLAFRQKTLEITRIAISDAAKNFGKAAPLSPDIYYARAKWAGTVTADCMELAALALDLRIAAMSRFLGENIEVTIEDILTAMVDVVKDTSKEELFNRLVALGGQPLGVIVEVSGYVNKVTARVKKMHEAYRPRGAEDELFEFRRILADQEQLLADIRDTLHMDLQALTASEDKS